jgi:pyrroline-5-carboxylate reductase
VSGRWIGEVGSSNTARTVASVDPMAHELVVVGGGNMGAALLGGMLSSGVVTAAEVAVVEPIPGRRTQLSEMFPGVAVVDAVPPCRSAVVAVKPPDVPDVVGAAVAAGRDPGAVDRRRGHDRHRARRPPATASPSCGRCRTRPPSSAQGVSAIAGGEGATEDDLAWAERILAGVGLVVRVSESQLDAVTGLTGSGPAYVFLVAEALMDAGVAAGLPRAPQSRW